MTWIYRDLFCAILIHLCLFSSALLKEQLESDYGGLDPQTQTTNHPNQNNTTNSNGDNDNDTGNSDVMASTPNEKDEWRLLSVDNRTKEDIAKDLFRRADWLRIGSCLLACWREKLPKVGTWLLKLNLCSWMLLFQRHYASLSCLSLSNVI